MDNSSALTPQATVKTTTPVSSTTNEYAGFGPRFVASIIDSIIVGFVNGMVNFIPNMIMGVLSSTTSSASAATQATLLLVQMGAWVINLIIVYGYYIYFIGNRGQTLGKMAMKIKVIREDGTEPVGYTNAFLRETVGKMLSGIVLGLGYLWMLWDSKKQTWHDKIAHTIVVKV